MGLSAHRTAVGAAPAPNCFSLNRDCGSRYCVRRIICLDQRASALLPVGPTLGADKRAVGFRRGPKTTRAKPDSKLMSSLLRAAAGWVSSSFLLSEGRVLFE